MIEPTASLAIVRAVGGNLVFSGNDDTNPFGLLSMNEPALQARVTYATESIHVSGALPTQTTWQLSMLNAVVGVRADTQQQLEDRKAEIRAAIAPLSFSAIQTINGVALPTWSCVRGSMTQYAGNHELDDLASFEAYYVLSIPVQPLEA